MRMCLLAFSLIGVQYVRLLLSPVDHLANLSYRFTWGIEMTCMRALISRQIPPTLCTVR